VTGIEITSDGALLDVATSAGPIASPPTVIAADGAGSTVRRLMD
jgi:2-polyprenyl-6-methoxyphenol hydroxylase-like FAD-dependent oxidoreductase